MLTIEILLSVLEVALDICESNSNYSFAGEVIQSAIDKIEDEYYDEVQ